MLALGDELDVPLIVVVRVDGHDPLAHVPNVKALTRVAGEKLARVEPVPLAGRGALGAHLECRLQDKVALPEAQGLHFAVL